MAPGKAERHEPLILFVHVPKAGGTTVNRHLQQFSAHGLHHCQKLLEHEQRLARKLRQLDWISGHVTFNRLYRRVSKHTERPIRSFTVVRDPVEQVASHYNWVLRLRQRRGLRYWRHPREIREIADRLYRSDNTDPDAVIANLRDAPLLFLDMQTRYVLGRQHGQSADAIRDGLSRYEMVTTTRHIAEIVERMTEQPAAAIGKENTSPYLVDPVLFRDGPLRRFLEEANARDEALFAQVTAGHGATATAKGAAD